ncbi:MAG: SRPBCC family protein [Candidatus Lambdaproteobacteria bacterium]|nr:SRPBCC family protein [Candidatus Lambdaproteobacteria bacterium]
MGKTDSDRIEKSILLRAPRSRVWRALTDAGEFGAWFRVKLAGNFAVGKSIRGSITYPGYEHLTLEMTVERMEPERLFSFRWHSDSVDPQRDYASEPATLVEFRLEEAAADTRLTVVESGYDQFPPGRRDEAFRMNAEGWDIQMENIQRHVAA